VRVLGGLALVLFVEMFAVWLTSLWNVKHVDGNYFELSLLPAPAVSVTAVAVADALVCHYKCFQGGLLDASKTKNLRCPDMDQDAPILCMV
jgi:hypothetical protein